MSRLPPRCPPPRTRSLDVELQASKLIRFPSVGSVLEEQHPFWLDELLTEGNDSPKGVALRRSASDSAAIVNEGNVDCGEFEGSCVYGPNSPRKKSELTSSESSIVNALLESVPRNYPLQHVSFDVAKNYVEREFGTMEGDIDAEKAARRRSGQRSRVRKLQYIAELERTVDAFQTLGAELATGVASLFQQRVALSAENKNIRRQIASLRQEKMMKDSQYQSLKIEAEKLKVIYGRHRRSKSAASCFETSTAENDPSGTQWQMLDIGKLSLGGSPVSFRHGSRH